MNLNKFQKSNLRNPFLLAAFTIGGIMIQSQSHAQWAPALNPADIANTNTGKVGINTQTPSERLTVNDGNISMPATNDKTIRVITADSKNGMLYIGTDVNTTKFTTDGPSIQMAGVTNAWRQGGIWYHAFAQNTDTAWGNAHMFLNYNYKRNNWTGLMAMRDEDGFPKIIIGTVPSQPDGYSLFVQHGILTEKVKVALTSSSNWADYVFADDYELKPLSEVEDFIAANKHLPGVPSGESIVKDGGIDMNAMFAKQMEKIEELTLYMIDLKKEVDQLKKENKKLRATVR